MATNKMIGQSFTHMVDTEAEAEKVVEEYKAQYVIKKSTITQKVKKEVEYWKVDVVVEHISEKDAFANYFFFE